ncbi:MAG: FUSC family protein [Oscillospiraceae bacterium]|nr:FUSC family protein [Oscillospiraceae bacterium]
MYEYRKLPVGLRTIKTAIAVIAAMIVADQFGGTGDKLVFAMLGAMSVIEPTFKASLEACLSQIIGVIVGAIISVLLLALPISGLTAVGIGIIVIIVLYNKLHLRISPSLPCLIMVMMCTGGNQNPLLYALGRVWDTAIGLIVGTAINMLLFPYNNSHNIWVTVKSLDRDLVHFLEDMFDGDRALPDAKKMNETISSLEKQLNIFGNQRLLFHFKQQKKELEQYQVCERQAKKLVSHMEVLSQLEIPGRLSPENRKRLAACGAEIRDGRKLDSVMELDVVTNFHVSQILSIRRELLDTLNGK